MGAFADDATERLRERLARTVGGTWETEARVAGTRVDVLGRVGEEIIAVEVEWRRADPVNNTAKLFRHLAEERLDAARVEVVQAFTRYYDLADGGVSSKRANAEFVGEVAAETVERLAYRPLTLDIEPPRRDGARPDGWEAAVDSVAASVADRL